mmetsp:Transcript_6166/g.20438  ORF Transcript_6166/g.20438 Transcript_6166/m.20438 type:complete len:240 (-) Transcript_6166:549-1268(-)
MGFTRRRRGAACCGGARGARRRCWCAPHQRRWSCPTRRCSSARSSACPPPSPRPWPSPTSSRGCSRISSPSPRSSTRPPTASAGAGGCADGRARRPLRGRTTTAPPRAARRVASPAPRLSRTRRWPTSSAPRPRGSSSPRGRSAPCAWTPSPMNARPSRPRTRAPRRRMRSPPSTRRWWGCAAGTRCMSSVQRPPCGWRSCGTCAARCAASRSRSRVRLLRVPSAERERARRCHDLFKR